MKPLIALVCALVLLAGTAACGSEDGAASGPPVQTGSADGILILVTAEQLVLTTPDGDEITFALRAEDVRRLDLLHLQLHARDRLQSRVHYEQQADKLYATQVDDL